MTTLWDVRDYALTFEGVPYQWGGVGPPESYGIDCSGFMQKVLSFAGFTFDYDHSAHELYRRFKGGFSDVGLGTLAFFGTNRKIVHVGFMLDDKMMLSAAGGNEGCTTLYAAKRMNASVKQQSIFSYRNPPLFLTAFPKYPFLESPRI